LRIDKLDIFSQVGANAALVISLPVTVTDGQLNIAFTPVVQQPKISAIEVLSGAAASAGAAPSAVSFYDLWRPLHFSSAELDDPVVSGETSDPDGDRINNLMEYALGLDPRVADVQGRPAAKIENGFLVFTYSRNKGATDVVLTEEVATQLTGPWSSSGLTPQVVNDDGEIQTVKVTDSVAVGTASSRFLRLTVQLRQSNSLSR